MLSERVYRESIMEKGGGGIDTGPEQMQSWGLVGQ